MKRRGSCRSSFGSAQDKFRSDRYELPVAGLPRNISLIAPSGEGPDGVGAGEEKRGEAQGEDGMAEAGTEILPEAGS